MEDDDIAIEVKDANGNLLQAGDSVVAIKDLKVKWASDIKRWDKFKNIRLTVRTFISDKLFLPWILLFLTIFCTWDYIPKFIFILSIQWILGRGRLCFIKKSYSIFTIL